MYIRSDFQDIDGGSGIPDSFGRFHEATFGLTNSSKPVSEFLSSWRENVSVRTHAWEVHWLYNVTAYACVFSDALSLQENIQLRILLPKKS